MLNHSKKCIKANSKAEVVYSDKGVSLAETMEQLSERVKDPRNRIERIIIYQPIEVLGREIKKIVDDVRKSLSHLDTFLKSQRKIVKKRSRRS